MSQIARKWIQDGAISPAKLDSSGDFVMNSLRTITDINVGGDVNVDGNLNVNGGVNSQDSTISGNLLVGRSAGIGPDSTNPNLYNFQLTGNSGYGKQSDPGYYYTTFDINHVGGYGNPASHFTISAGGGFLYFEDRINNTVPLSLENKAIYVGDVLRLDSILDSSISSTSKLTIHSDKTTTVEGNEGVYLNAPEVLFSTNRVYSFGNFFLHSGGDFDVNAQNSNIGVDGTLILTGGSYLELHGDQTTRVESNGGVYLNAPEVIFSANRVYSFGDFKLKSDYTTKLEGAMAYIRLDNDAFISAMNATISAGDIQITGTTSRIASTRDTSVFAIYNLDIYCGGDLDVSSASTIYVKAENDVYVERGKIRLATGTGELISKFDSGAYIIESTGSPLQIRTLANEDMTAFAQGGLRLKGGRSLDLNSDKNININCDGTVLISNTGDITGTCNGSVYMFGSKGVHIQGGASDTTITTGGYLNLNSSSGILINSAPKVNGLLSVKSTSGKKGIYSWTDGSGTVGIYARTTNDPSTDQTAIYAEALASNVALEIGSGKIVVDGDVADTTNISFLDAGNNPHVLHFKKGILVEVT